MWGLSHSKGFQWPKSGIFKMMSKTPKKSYYRNAQLHCHGGIMRSEKMQSVVAIGESTIISSTNFCEFRRTFHYTPNVLVLQENSNESPIHSTTKDIAHNTKKNINLPNTSRLLLLSEQAAASIDEEQWIDAENILGNLLQFCGVQTGVITGVEEEINRAAERLREEEMKQEEAIKAEANKDMGSGKLGSSSGGDFTVRDIMRQTSTRLDSDELKKKREAEKAKKEQSWIAPLAPHLREKQQMQLQQLCEEDIKKLEAMQVDVLGMGGISRGKDQSTTPIPSSEAAVCGFLGRHLYLLAFAQQSVGKRRLSEGHYRRALVLLETSGDHLAHELALAKLNFAELLTSLNKIYEAEEVAREALPLVQLHFGKESELYGAITSNLGSYMCAQEKFEEAEEVCMEGLAVLHKTLGADNDLTQSALHNCMAVLKQTDPTALEKFKEDWAKKGKTEVGEVPGPTDSELSRVMDSFKEDAKSKTFDPRGWMKDSSFSKEELRRFLEHQQATSGKEVDPDVAHALARELSAIQRREQEEEHDLKQEEEEQREVPFGGEEEGEQEEDMLGRMMREAITQTRRGGEERQVPEGVDLEALERASEMEEPSPMEEQSAAARVIHHTSQSIDIINKKEDTTP